MTERFNAGMAIMHENGVSHISGAVCSSCSPEYVEAVNAWARMFFAEPQTLIVGGEPADD